MCSWSPQVVCEIYRLFFWSFGLIAQRKLDQTIFYVTCAQLVVSLILDEVQLRLFRRRTTFMVTSPILALKVVDVSVFSDLFGSFAWLEWNLMCFSSGLYILHALRAALAKFGLPWILAGNSHGGADVRLLQYCPGAFFLLNNISGHY